MALIDMLLDPERRKVASEDQEKLRLIIGHRVARDPAIAKHLHGRARERLALDLLDTAEEREAGEDERLFAQLAEGLALQGRYEEAIDLAPEGPYKEQYMAYAAAVEEVNEQQCGHFRLRPEGSEDDSSEVLKDLTTRAREAGLSETAIQEHRGDLEAMLGRQEATQLLIERVWNGRVTITFTRCIICGAISAYA